MIMQVGTSLFDGYAEEELNSSGFQPCNDIDPRRSPVHFPEPEKRRSGNPLQLRYGRKAERSFFLPMVDSSPAIPCYRRMESRSYLFSHLK